MATASSTSLTVSAMLTAWNSVALVDTCPPSAAQLRPISSAYLEQRDRRGAQGGGLCGRGRAAPAGGPAPRGAGARRRRGGRGRPRRGGGGGRRLAGLRGG